MAKKLLSRNVASYTGGRSNFLQSQMACPSWAATRSPRHCKGFSREAGNYLPTYEVIYLITKPKFKLSPKANAHGDVWEFTQEMNNDHPAAFPVNLIDRIIGSTNAKIVLDPFMGSGTTAVSAINFKRNYIGIDVSPDYCEMARKRIKLHQLQTKLW